MASRSAQKQFGSIFKKKFSKNSATSRKAGSRKPKKASPWSSRIKFQKRPAQPEPEISQLPVEVRVETKIETKEVVKEVIKEVIKEVPAPVQPQGQKRPVEWGMLTTDFVRPGPNLKSSMEGFMLDQRSEHTQVAYGKDVKRFVKFLLVRINARGPEPLGRNVFVAYKDWLVTEGLEHTTVDRHLATLRSLFKWLVEDDMLERNPVENVRFLKPKRVSTTIGFTDDEVRKVLDQPNLHTRTGAMHFSILMILFFGGLRRSEVCQLRTSNLGVERGHWVLRLRGKGNKERVIPLKRAVWESLKHYFIISRKDPKKDQFLFTPVKNNRTNDFSKPIDASMIYYIVQRYSKMAGVANRVSPHSCRATAISNARDHNVADRAIQEFAGWSSTDMITRYDKRKTAVEDSAAHSIDYGKKGRSLPITRLMEKPPSKSDGDESDIEAQLADLEANMEMPFDDDPQLERDS